MKHTELPYQLVAVDYDPFEGDAESPLRPIAPSANPFGGTSPLQAQKDSVEFQRSGGNRADLNKPVVVHPVDNDRFGPPIMDPMLPDFNRFTIKSIE